MGKKYHIRHREFLNRTRELPAYILAVVEDTAPYPNDGDDWKWGTITLKMSDCYNSVSYSFDMDTAAARRNSLVKISRLAKAINAFQAAMEKEAESISKRPRPKKQKQQK